MREPLPALPAQLKVVTRQRTGQKPLARRSSLPAEVERLGAIHPEVAVNRGVRRKGEVLGLLEGSPELGRQRLVAREQDVDVRRVLGRPLGAVEGVVASVLSEHE